jgi:hypothetical protein
MHSDIRQFFREVVRLCQGKNVCAIPQSPDGSRVDAGDYSDAPRGLLWPANSKTGLIKTVDKLAEAVRYLRVQAGRKLFKYKVLKKDPLPRMSALAGQIDIYSARAFHSVYEQHSLDRHYPKEPQWVLDMIFHLASDILEGRHPSVLMTNGSLDSRDSPTIFLIW